MKKPEQYLACKKTKSLSGEHSQMKDYVKWVEKHFVIDPDTKVVQFKNATTEAESSSGVQGECQHLDYNNKGSSARYRRFTCNDVLCKHTWNEERQKVEEDFNPTTCKHLKTDHRGSTKNIRRTCCIDCKAYIDAVAQALVV